MKSSEFRIEWCHGWEADLAATFGYFEAPDLVLAPEYT